MSDRNNSCVNTSEYRYRFSKKREFIWNMPPSLPQLNRPGSEAPRGANLICRIHPIPRIPGSRLPCRLTRDKIDLLKQTAPLDHG
jgi:hypothetical protein